MEKFFQIFQDLHFDISFADALLLMPKFASTIKSLLTNKDKLLELAKIPLNENCSAMLLKKLPEKLGDLGVAEDVFVKVGKFHFSTDFVLVDFEADPRVPLILGKSFLRTGRALIDVYGEEITLRVNDEAVTFNLNQTTRYSSTYGDLSVNRIDIIDVAREEGEKNCKSHRIGEEGKKNQMKFEKSKLRVSPNMYKEYVAEFWYSAKTLKNSKVFFSTPTADIYGKVGVNTFRNAIGAYYLPHSSEYVAPPSIDIVRPWFETIRKPFTRSPNMYKEYLAEFWYPAKTLENSKVFFSTPTGGIYGEVGVNTFRIAIGAHYLPHSSKYVAPSSIDIVRSWFETIRYGESVPAKETLKKSFLPP
nr:reverse transcriptase domain-containing protein [Tanacetum cinerariifolium]